MFKFNFEVENRENSEHLEKTLLQTNTSVGDDQTGNDSLGLDESSRIGIYTYGELEATATQRELVFKQLYLNKNLNTYESENENYEDEENESESNKTESKDETKKLHQKEPNIKYACVNYIDSSQVKTDQDLDVINKTHDLVPGKYEGGLKLWELSIDLARFIFNVSWFELSAIQPETLRQELQMVQEFFQNVAKTKNLNILEIGCGHAVPSLSALRLVEELWKRNETVKGESLHVKVYLQDFNEEILKAVTFENVKKFWQVSELSQLGVKCEFKFVFGDWRRISSENLLPRNFFHLILTSETIYNAVNYKHLLNMFRDCLVSTDVRREQPNEIGKKLKLDRESQQALVLVSAKTYYFGCGGNVLEFARLARSNNYGFKVSTNLLVESIVGNFQRVEIERRDEHEQKEFSECSLSKEIVKLNFLSIN